MRIFLILGLSFGPLYLFGSGAALGAGGDLYSDYPIKIQVTGEAMPQNPHLECVGVEGMVCVGKTGPSYCGDLACRRKGKWSGGRR